MLEEPPSGTVKSRRNPNHSEMETISPTPHLGSDVREYKSLYHNRSFLIFWVGQSLSSVGDAVATVALPLLVLQATGSVVQMGFVTAILTVSSVISSLLSGIIVDRVDRRWLLIICDIGRVLLYSSIPLVWLLAGPQLWLIYVVVALGTCLATCFYVAHNAMLPHLVENEQMTLANGWLQAWASLSFVLGPVLAGLVSTIWGPSMAVGIDALSFVISALSLLFVRLRQSASLQKESRVSLNKQELLAGIHFLLHQPTLRAVSLLSMIFYPLVAPALDLFIFRLKHDLSQPDGTVGVILSVVALGGILGGLLASVLRRWLGFGMSWLGSMVFVGLVAMGVGLTANVWLMAFLAAGFTFGQILMDVNSIVLRQQLTPDHLLGRVTAASWTMYGLLGSVSVTVLTALVAWLGTPTVFVSVGVIVLAIATIGAFTSARMAHPERKS
jgi:MFS family permease